MDTICWGCCCWWWWWSWCGWCNWDDVRYLENNSQWCSAYGLCSILWQWLYFVFMLWGWVFVLDDCWWIVLVTLFVMPYVYLVHITQCITPLQQMRIWVDIKRFGVRIPGGLHYCWPAGAMVTRLTTALLRPLRVPFCLF